MPVSLGFRVPADGEYRVEARAQGRSTGTLTLVAAAQTVDVASRPLTAGQPVPGEMATPDEVDVYTFTGAPGTVAHLTLAADDELETTLAVTGPGNPGIADRGDGQSVLAFVVPQDGTYEARASLLGTEEHSGRTPYRLTSNCPRPPV